MLEYIYVQQHYCFNMVLFGRFFLAHIQKTTLVTDNYCIFSVKAFCGLFLYADFPAGYCLFHTLCFVRIRI